MRVDYFIYYRVRNDCSVELMAALVSMQAALHAATGIAGRFRRRVDDPTTWMEIYEGVADAHRFEVELGALARSHGLNAFLAPGTVRHLERFRTVS
jgi:hypothetical protein